MTEGLHIEGISQKRENVDDYALKTLKIKDI